jgi:hypothetical protein
MTDATPTQPTGSSKLIWRKPLTEDVVEFGTAPDPRDARIAELEAALRETRKLLLDYRFGQGKRIGQAVEFIEAELWTPERDMTMAVEEWDA